MDFLSWRHRMVSALLVCAPLWGVAPAWAAQGPVKAAVQAGGDRATGSKSTASSVRFIDAPSSEKPAARERRLKRECKGRPNAGVCLGYTR